MVWRHLFLVHVMFSPNRQRGGAAIEFALIFPILVLLFLLSFDWGLVAYQALNVQAAAQAGAQYASLNTWNYTAIAQVVAGATAGDPGSITADPTQTRTFYACPTGTALVESPRTSVCPDSSAPRLYGTVFAQEPYSAVLPMPPGLPSLPSLITAQATRRLQ